MMVRDGAWVGGGSIRSLYLQERCSLGWEGRGGFYQVCVLTRKVRDGAEVVPGLCTAGMSFSTHGEDARTR